MTAGRPTEYDKVKTIKKAQEYMDLCKSDRIENYHKVVGARTNSYDRIVHANLPTLEGLACHLGVNRDTVYAWKDDKKKPEFSDICKALLTLQASRLQEGAISGHYNPSITTMLLSRQGIKAAQEVEHNINPELLSALTKLGSVLK